MRKMCLWWFPLEYMFQVESDLRERDDGGNDREDAREDQRVSGFVPFLCFLTSFCPLSLCSFPPLRVVCAPDKYVRLRAFFIMKRFSKCG